jgi:hypothetical protein
MKKKVNAGSKKTHLIGMRLQRAFRIGRGAGPIAAKAIWATGATISLA